MTVLAAHKVSSKLNYVDISNTLITMSALTLAPLTQCTVLEHDYFLFPHRVSTKSESCSYLGTHLRRVN